MGAMERYHVLPDKLGIGVVILDTRTGYIQHPACWQDISAYYHYLVGKGRLDEAQGLLEESMSGNKPITKMVERMRQSAFWESRQS